MKQLIDSPSGSPGLAWRTLRNSVYGGISFVWPVVLALFASPFIVHHLGPDLFGVLSIVGVTLGLFGFLDFGVGGAATRQIAAHYERKEHDNVNQVVSSVLGFYLLVGVVAAVAIIALADVLVTRVLSVPLALQGTARTAFYLAAPSFAISLVSGSLSSIPPAIQRYDVSTKYAVVLTTVTTITTVAILAMGGSIVAVMAAGLGITLVTLPVNYTIAKRLLPDLAIRPTWDTPMLRELFRFGGYFLLSSVGVMLLYQADKLLVGAFLGVAAVTFYVVPGNLAQKIQGFIASTAAVTFPVSSALFESGAHDTLVRLYREGTRAVYLVAMMMTVPLAVFADKFLTYWMGTQISAGSAHALTILAVTYFLLGVTSVPWGIANGSGRAKINALFTLAIAALDIGAFLLLVPAHGVTGAAAAYLFSAVVGVPVLIWYIERHVLRLSGFEFVKIFWRIGVVAAIQVALSFAMRPLCTRLLTTIAVIIVSALLCPLLYFVLGFAQEGDRRMVRMVVARFRG